MKIERIIVVILLAILLISWGWFLTPEDNIPENQNQITVVEHEVKITFPNENTTLAGIIDPELNISNQANWSRTDYFIDGIFIGWVTPYVDVMWRMLINTSDYENGEHIFSVICYWDGEYDQNYTSSISYSDAVSVIIDNK